MNERTVREVLNRLRWDAGEDGAAAALEYVTRGEEGERCESAAFADVVEILPAGMTLAGGTFIPYHRLRRVRRGGETLWRARERRGGDEG